MRCRGLRGDDSVRLRLGKEFLTCWPSTLGWTFKMVDMERRRTQLDGQVQDQPDLDKERPNQASQSSEINRVLAVASHTRTNVEL